MDNKYSNNRKSGNRVKNRNKLSYFLNRLAEPFAKSFQNYKNRSTN